MCVCTCDCLELAKSLQSWQKQDDVKRKAAESKKLFFIMLATFHAEKIQKKEFATEKSVTGVVQM